MRFEYVPLVTLMMAVNVIQAKPNAYLIQTKNYGNNEDERGSDYLTDYRDLIHLSDADDGCYDSDGYHVQVGESFKLECNSCECTSRGKYWCTEKGCLSGN